MSAPVIRPIGPDEVDLFTSFADASPLGLKPPLAMYLDGLHRWYRPAWSWVALRDGQVVARVAFSGPPEAALLACDPTGRCVGITVPGLRPWGADISYVGVLPEHRGNGYADELLLEASHLLVEGGATEIVAATDVGNTPMAAAFARCGYLVVDRLMVHV